MFNQLIVSGKNARGARKPWSLLVSVALQSLLIGVLILIPLIYTEALPKAMLSTFIVAPAPPPPPPPPPIAAVKVKPIKLAQVIKTSPVAPAFIPKKIEIEKDQAAPDVAANTGNGIPGGTGDVLGGIAGNGPVMPPPPPKPQAPQRIKLGGQVAAAKLINKVQPQYPQVAQAAHVTGTVVLHAIISKSGDIEQLQLVSGPPLLAKAAMDAVTQWRYRPTVLNGQPVEVDTTINVVFALG